MLSAQQQQHQQYKLQQQQQQQLQHQQAAGGGSVGSVTPTGPMDDFSAMMEFETTSVGSLPPTQYQQMY